MYELYLAGVLFSVLVVVLVLVTLGIIMIVRYCVRSSKHRVTTLPGLDMSHPELGNFLDIAKAGSLHQFLMSLHKKYGDIASFWWGKKMTVSVCSPELFKQQSKHFDQPLELIQMFRPFTTEASIQYASGPEGQARHATYSRCFSETAMANYYPVMHKTTRDFIEKLEKLPEDEHVPLREYMLGFAIKTVLLGVFGEAFADDKAVLSLKRSYDHVWQDLETQLTFDLSQSLELSERLKFQQECRNNIHGIMKTFLNKYKENPSDDPSKSNFLDVISSLDISLGEKSADIVTVFVASFHTTGLLLTWALYYMTLHPDVQRKATEEVDEVLGKHKALGPDNINQLVYLRQVIDETMRCSVLAPYAARSSEEDSQLAGHHIPGGTPVIHALGVSLQDPSRWPQPEKFDPDRFSPSNRRKIPDFGFEPFGFAGKRKCLGFRFGLAESTIFLAGLLRKFEVRMVPGQEVVPVHGLVTTPREEIWLTFKRRE